MDTMICDDFRSNVIAILDRKCMSRSELARRMGKTPQFVSQMLNGVRDPGLAMVEKFANALGVEPYRLVKKLQQNA